MEPADMLNLLSFEYLHYGRPQMAWLGTDETVSTQMKQPLSSRPRSGSEDEKVKSELEASSVRPFASHFRNTILDVRFPGWKEVCEGYDEK
jgi:hypothetical protein